MVFHFNSAGGGEEPPAVPEEGGRAGEADHPRRARPPGAGPIGAGRRPSGSPPIIAGGGAGQSGNGGRAPDRQN